MGALARARARVPHEFGKRRDDAFIRLLRSDGQAQELAHAIGADRAQHKAARSEETIGVHGRAARRVGKANGDEIGDARQNVEAERRDLARQPGQPALIMRDRRVDMGLVRKRGDSRDGRRARHVEGRADAVQARR